MAFSLAGMSTTLMGWFSSFIFWGILALIFLIVTWGSLAVRKNRKMSFPVHEHTDIGGGKMGIKTTKGGWFKSKWFLGLYDYAGEDIFMIKDGRVVQDLSSGDYHDINGIRGVVCQRKGDDPKVLVPISKMQLSNDAKKAIFEVAPADFRDSSKKIIERAENETMSKLEKLLTPISLAICAIIFLIALILVIQYSNHQVTEAKSILFEAMRIAGQGAKTAVSTASTIAP